MTDLAAWLARYDATPPEDARRRQALREGLVLDVPDMARELLDLRAAMEVATGVDAGTILANWRALNGGRDDD